MAAVGLGQVSCVQTETCFASKRSYVLGFVANANSFVGVSNIVIFFQGHRKPIFRWLFGWCKFFVRLLFYYCGMIVEFLFLSPAIVFCLIVSIAIKSKVFVVGKTSNISGFIPGIEQELRRLSFNKRDLSRIVILNLSDDANSEVRELFDQVVTIYGSECKLRRRVFLWIYRFRHNGSHLVEDKSSASWSQPSRNIRFSDSKIVAGNNYLEMCGIPSQGKFICYAVRSESYYLSQIARGAKLLPRTVRNPDETLYLNVVSKICDEYFPVFRMGKDLDVTIDTAQYPKVIDYALRNRSDFLDVFLLANCKFLLLGNTGLFWISSLFNKPTAHCDLYDIRHQVIVGDLMIFQKLWLKKERRLATVSEMLGMGGFYSKESHQNILGVELVKNTEEEIFSLFNEMNSRVDNSWESSDDDEELQNRYGRLVMQYSNKPTWRGGGRVGTQFLRDNQDLLK